MYLDILGFSDMVADKSRILKLFEIIDELNVFTHKKNDFKCVVFSDTVLIHSPIPWDRCRDDVKAWLVMYACEFAKDLFYRLIGRDIHFRALLSVGDFEHRSLSNFDAFFGNELVRLHQQERKILCSGLLIDNNLLKYCNIFRTTMYDQDFHYVHLMQDLKDFSWRESAYPFDADLFCNMDIEPYLVYDLKYLENVYTHLHNQNLPQSVRAKYDGTWRMICSRHAGLLNTLVKHNFNPRSISKIDWSSAMHNVGTPQGAFG